MCTSDIDVFTLLNNQYRKLSDQEKTFQVVGVHTFGLFLMYAEHIGLKIWRYLHLNDLE